MQFALKLSIENLSRLSFFSSAHPKFQEAMDLKLSSERGLD